MSIYANKQINKKLVVYKRYKSNELNPFAQEQMIKALESEMQNELIKEIIFEVNAFEM
jgi:outer membrane lipopolysaccharide assembly protein LptE/RlpB